MFGFIFYKQLTAYAGNFCIYCNRAPDQFIKWMLLCWKILQCEWKDFNLSRNGGCLNLNGGFVLHKMVGDWPDEKFQSWLLKCTRSALNGKFFEQFVESRVL